MNFVSGTALKFMKHQTYCFFVRFWPSSEVKFVYQATSSPLIHWSEVPVSQLKRPGPTQVHLLSFEFLRASDEIHILTLPLKTLNSTAISCV